MPLSRRKTLAILGGGTILAATAATAHIATRQPTAARQPWEAAGGAEDILRFALSYAILAPNPHNLQPWLVDLSQTDKVVLHRDPQRTLPETDPYGRQLTIGLGCFLEIMRIAAASRGWSVDLALFPEGEEGPVAVADFSAGGTAPDPLFDHVLDRRSCKEPFADTPVADNAVAALSNHGRIITESNHVAAIRDLTWEAWKVEAETPRTYLESVDLMRFGKAEIEANPDGIDLGGGMLELLITAGLLNREAQLDTSSMSYQEGFRIYEEMLMATPAYAVIVSDGNSRVDQIEAGQRWVRLNLQATAQGVSLHPVSQALQEYPEMAEHYASAHAMLAETGQTVQMLGRLGYGPDVAPSPRWPLDARIMNG